MEFDRSRNRKLLVSVFNSQEAREGVVGGARIIDSEDPRSALGNIKPLQIMKLSRAVLDYTRDREVQLSTNIGEDQLLFDRSELGLAIQKSAYEIAGKSSQAAVGVAMSMGTDVHKCPIVKVGVDGMPVDLVKNVLQEVVHTLKRTKGLQQCSVMSVLFAQDLNIWDERKHHPYVRKILIGLRNFHYSEESSSDVFDLMTDEYLVKTIRDDNGRFLFNDASEIPSNDEVVQILKELGVLPRAASLATIKLNELLPHEIFFPGTHVPDRRTNQEIIAAMVDVTKESGAHSIMLDTRIQSKVARISLAKTSADGLIDINSLDEKQGIVREGVLPLADLRFFVDYCHVKGLEANLAGSFQSYHAQQVWLMIPTLDQISTRGGSSAVQIDPRSSDHGTDTRQFRVTNRNLVRGLAPPEQGGILNIPSVMKSAANAEQIFDQLKDMLSDARQQQELPPLKAYFVDKFGNQDVF